MSSKKEKPWCSKRVYRSTSVYRGAPCSRRGVVQETDGKWYCRQHSPAEALKRQQKAEAIYEKKLAARKAPFLKIEDQQKTIEELHAKIEKLRRQLNKLRLR